MNASSELFEGLTVALRALAALLLVVFTAAFSLRATWLLLPRASIPLRWSTVFGVGVWSSTLGFHLLRGLGAFQLHWALLGCGGLGFLTFFTAPTRAPLRQVAGRELRAVRALWRTFRRGREQAITAAFATFAVLLTARALILPPLGWDSLVYHLPRAALWVQTGQFTFAEASGCYGYYRNFISGGEVLTAWAMLPFHSDLLVNLSTHVEWVGVGLASWALARALGLREPFASTSVAVVMFIPTLQLELGSGYVEPALAFALLHGAALALVGFKRPERATVVLAAMSLGIAVGTKVLAAPPAAAIGFALIGRLLRARELPLGARAGWSAAALGLGVLPMLPWAWGAWSTTGYPLSPLPVHFFGLTLGIPSPEFSWYSNRPGLAPYTWDAEWRALQIVFALPGTRNESLGLLAAIPLAVFPVGFVALLRRRPLAALALTLAAATMVGVHFSPALSVVRLMWPTTVSRFLIPLLGLVVPVSLAWCRRGQALSVAYRWALLAWPLLFSVLRFGYGWGTWEWPDVLGVLGALAAMISALVWLARRRRVAALVLGCGLWAVSCAALQLRCDHTRPLAFAQSLALHESPRYWAEAVALVDSPGIEHRLAITSGPDQDDDNWFAYPFFGRRLQNRITWVTPTRGGELPSPGGDNSAALDPSAWRRRLLEQGITEVLSFAPASIEQRWMESAPEKYRKLAGAGAWGLYRVLADPPGAPTP